MPTSHDELAQASPACNQELASVIQLIAAKEQSMMTQLYDLTNHLLYGFILRILRDAPAAEEVLLDVYMQVWRQAYRYDNTRGSPLAWMMTIARSRALDRLRAEGQRNRLREPLEEAMLAANHAHEQKMPVVEIRQAICEALSALSPEQRKAIELAYYEGLTHSEIAQALKQPVGTVKSNIRRGMIRLREKINPTYLDLL